MSKRKADSSKEQNGASSAKKTRTGGKVAAAPESEHQASIAIDVAIAQAKLASQLALKTLRFQEAILSDTGSHTQRMQTVANQLKEDVDQPQPLVDLSRVLADGEVGLGTPTLPLAERASVMASAVLTYDALLCCALLLLVDSRACCLSCCDFSNPAFPLAATAHRSRQTRFKLRS